MTYLTQRSLTPDERHELDTLTEAITEAIQARTAWLDAKMVETSRLQVGDDIYDIDSGVKLGTVSELYRFSKNQGDAVNDDSHYCDYQYEVGRLMFDNTSRHGGTRSFGTREDAIRHAEAHAARLRAGS